MKKVAQKAKQFKQNVHGYCQICCLPLFTLGLVMASRVSSHYTHTSWFKLSPLSEMIDMYGTISELVQIPAAHLTIIDTVHH